MHPQTTLTPFNKTTIEDLHNSRWALSPEYEKRVDEAVRRVLRVLHNPVSPDLDAKDLDHSIWYVSERMGCSGDKRDVRFVTPAAVMAHSLGQQVVLEHVTPRKETKTRLLALGTSATPDEVEEVLRSVVVCVVSKDEDRRLNLTKGETGWGRYFKAGVIPVDRLNGAFLNPAL